MFIPDSVFCGQSQFSGNIVMSFTKGSFVNSFIMRKDEHVMSLRAFEELRKKAGLPPGDSEAGRL